MDTIITFITNPFTPPTGNPLQTIIIRIEIANVTKKYNPCFTKKGLFPLLK